MSEKLPYIVGAKKNPDGTWDYSQAASWEGPKQEQPAKQPSTQDLEKRRRELDEVWRRSQETQRKSTEAERAKTAGEVEDVYKQLGVESPHEREKACEQAIGQVLEDGGIGVFGSFTEKIIQESFYQSQPGAGFKDATSPRLSRAKGQFSESLSRISSMLDQNEINEAVIFERVQEPIIEQVTIPGKTKWGGFKKEPDRTEYRKTGHNKTHADLVQGGKSETPIRIVYTAKHIRTEADQRDKYSWNDYSGRGGNQIGIEIFVPESTAQEIKRLIDSDPTFIRQVVERVMKEKVLRDTNEWKEEENPTKGSVRPPYERWDSKPEGGQIYVQTEDMTPGFHREAVRKVKK